MHVGRDEAEYGAASITPAKRVPHRPFAGAVLSDDDRLERNRLLDGSYERNLLLDGGKQRLDAAMMLAAPKRFPLRSIFSSDG